MGDRLPPVMPSTGGWLNRYRPRAETMLYWSFVISGEALLASGYVLMSNVRITNHLVLVYPFVWINTGIWAVLRANPSSTYLRRRVAAILLSSGYFLVLTYFGGLLAFADGASYGIEVYWSLPPGYSPLLILKFESVRIIFEPYKAVGYVSLAYLVYTAILDTFGTALRGIVGIFACVSCTWPVLGTILAGLFGSTTVVISAVTNQPYAASTVVFLSAVGLLLWRPIE